MNSAGMKTTTICSASTSTTVKKPSTPLEARSSFAPSRSWASSIFTEGIRMSFRNRAKSVITANRDTSITILCVVFFMPLLPSVFNPFIVYWNAVFVKSRRSLAAGFPVEMRADVC